MILSGPFNSGLLNKSHILLFLSLFMVIMSALAVVYCTHKVRYLHASLEQLNVKETALRTEYSMLLLERSIWTADRRVEKIAAELGMVMPDKVIMIKP